LTGGIAFGDIARLRANYRRRCRKRELAFPHKRAWMLILPASLSYVRGRPKLTEAEPAYTKQANRSDGSGGARRC
jgi:hypothetical protein